MVVSSQQTIVGASAEETGPRIVELDELTALSSDEDGESATDTGEGGEGGATGLAPGELEKNAVADLESETQSFDPKDRAKAIEAAKRKQAEVGAEVATRSAQEGQRGEQERSRRQQRAKAKGAQARQRGAQARSKIQARKKKKPVTREQLKTRITTSCAEKRKKVTDNFESKKTELETKLKDREAQLVAEQVKQQTRLLNQMTAKSARLNQQIERRKAQHDALIATKIPAFEAQAEKDAERLIAEAAEQARTIKATGHKQGEAAKKQASISAIKVESDAEAAAAKAIAIGKKKAAEATAASAASKTDTIGESARTIGLGAQRATQALDAAKQRAREIRRQGRASAKRLHAAGAAESRKLKAVGDRRADEAFAHGEQAAEAVRQKARDGIAAMRGESDAAVKEMEAEVAAMAGKIAADVATLQAVASTEQAQAAIVVKAEMASAMAALEAEKTAMLTEIDTREQAELAKVDLASDKELARLEREIARDLKRLDREILAAERRINRAIASADRAVMREVARRKAIIRAEGQRANAAIAGYVRTARKGMAAADKDTKKEIGETGEKEIAALVEAGDKLSEENIKRSAAENSKLEKSGAQAVSELEKQGDSDGKKLDASADKLGGEIDDKWVADALVQAETKLDGDGLFNVVTDEEANAAMLTINSLPKHLQGKVVDQMDSDSFENLIDEVPEERREEFVTVLDTVLDPERKLKMWGEYHQSKAINDAERSGDDWRETIAEGTEDEVEEEVDFLLEQAKNGTPLTLAQVDKLAARKKLEHEVEMQYRVKVTNEEGARADGSKIVWTEKDLKEMQATFGEMPDHHVRNNTMFEEIRREDMSSSDEKRVAKGGRARIGGDHDDGRIRVYDLGLSGSYRHTGDARESGTAEAQSKIGPNISPLEEVIVHEVGHDIHDQNTDEWEKFQKASGWEKDIDTDDLKDRGFTAQELKDMKENDKTIERNGKVYNYRYGEYVAFDKDRIPATGQGSDTWSYARNNYKDHFAETYMKATLVPEQLAQDLLDTPAADVASKTAKRDTEVATRNADRAALAALKAKTPPPSQAEINAATNKLAASERKLAVRQSDLDEALADQEGLKQQYDIMRNDIFNSDKTTGEAVARLNAKGIDPAKLADFKAKAARLSTPEQITRLEAQY